MLRAAARSLLTALSTIIASIPPTQVAHQLGAQGCGHSMWTSAPVKTLAGPEAIAVEACNWLVDPCHNVREVEQHNRRALSLLSTVLDTDACTKGAVIQ